MQQTDKTDVCARREVQVRSTFGFTGSSADHGNSMNLLGTTPPLHLPLLTPSPPSNTIFSVFQTRAAVSVTRLIHN